MNAGQQTPEAKPPESTPETLRHAASAPDGTASSTGSQTPTGRMVSTRDAAHDVVFLCLVVAASLVLYIRGLGLYSDDWGHLQLMVNSPDHSFLGMLRVFYTEGWAISSRPLQAVYLTGLYSVFGINPFAFHLVNATVFVTAIALFYVSLVELGLPRALALTPPLVYVLLPHYSTMRFWYAAFQGNLSMLLLFLSFLACLRTVRSE